MCPWNLSRKKIVGWNVSLFVSRLFHFLCFSRWKVRTYIIPVARCASTTARCRTWTWSTTTTSRGIIPTRLCQLATRIWTRHLLPWAANFFHSCWWALDRSHVQEYPVRTVGFHDFFFFFFINMEKKLVDVYMYRLFWKLII